MFLGEEEEEESTNPQTKDKRRSKRKEKQKNSHHGQTEHRGQTEESKRKNIVEGNSLITHATKKTEENKTTIDDGDKRIKLAAKSTILCKQHRQHRRDCHQPAFTALTSAQSDSIRKKCGGGQTIKKKKNSLKEQHWTLKSTYWKQKGGSVGTR